MYNDNGGNNFFSSTPVHKVKNKCFSDLSEEYITKKLMDNSTQMASIMKKLNKCMEERKKFEKQLLEVSINQKPNQKTVYSFASQTTWTSNLSSIEKPRKLTLSEIDYTNSILNHSIISSNSRNGSRNKSENVVVKDHDNLTPVTDLSHHTSPKQSKLTDYNKLFSCDESILDIDAFYRENADESLLRFSERSDSKLLNNTIDRKLLRQLTFNSSVKSNEEMSQLSSFRSKDLLENRKFVETPQKISNDNDLYPFLNSDQFNRVSSNSSATLDVPIFKSHEKVVKWLKRKYEENDKYNVINTMKDNFRSISDTEEDSVDSDIELNESVNEFNSISPMDFTKFSSKNEHNEEDISKLKETLKKNNLVDDNVEGENKENENNYNISRFVTNTKKDDFHCLSDTEDSVDSIENGNNETDEFNSICPMDLTRFSLDYEHKPKERLKKNTLGDDNEEGMFSDEIKASLHSQNHYSRILGSIVTSTKKKAIHEFNKSKYPIFESIDDDDGVENLNNKFDNNKTWFEHSNSFSRQSIIINSKEMNESDNLNISNPARIARLLKENENVNPICENDNKNNNCTCYEKSPRNHDFSNSYDNHNVSRKNNFHRHPNSDINNTHMSNSENGISYNNNRFQKFITNDFNENLVNKKISSEKSQIYNDSPDSRNIQEDKSLELSQISICYDNIIQLMKENETLKEYLSDYKDNVNFKDSEIDELQDRLRHNEIGIRKYQYLLENTKKSFNYNLVKAENNANRLRDIIVEQAVLFINEYQQQHRQ